MSTGRFSISSQQSRYFRSKYHYALLSKILIIILLIIIFNYYYITNWILNDKIKYINIYLPHNTLKFKIYLLLKTWLHNVENYFYVCNKHLVYIIMILIT